MNLVDANKNANKNLINDKINEVLTLDAIPQAKQSGGAVDEGKYEINQKTKTNARIDIRHVQSNNLKTND
ncbi:hypothetical protein [Serratia marcescens]|uniref:hypothetical protein n=1 Tax=Serratia TaxID=613 RepID=UPI001A2CBDB2|nr:hypothetical protein [Serratia marcescens]HAT4985382.1 hypothetical protein [Serratia marcescens]HAT5032330.1 hypothetical protein [Serratia marcescens]